ncbi:DeoR family transcriptional regulator [Murinocardiopsis flavida]|uniref:DeoR family transcriptional regulator n=2 Tax=Murinocardiopsis flavida TaxID=645275 RepID=A0A2P8DTY4_9ACTN|nr:DeoR family transcriptional regulator [Murinocardiopsis flavida]
MEHIGREGTVAVTALSHGLGVSESSVRRDLNLLEAQRWISRTHGGAVARGTAVRLQMSPPDLDLTERQNRMAEIAAKRVPDGSTVGLVSGETIGGIGRVLADRSDLTIVTNAVDIAHQLLVRPHLRVVLTGGVADPETSALGGAFAESMLRQVNLAIAFVEVDGVHPRSGITVEESERARLTESFVAHAEQVVAVVPGTRVGRSCFVRVCALSAIDELVTDDDADEAALAAIAEAGVAVTIA